MGWESDEGNSRILSERNEGPLPLREVPRFDGGAWDDLRLRSARGVAVSEELEEDVSLPSRLSSVLAEVPAPENLSTDS